MSCGLPRDIPTMKSAPRFISFCAAILLASPISAKPLNLIAIVTDDQAAWTMGCYGGKEIPTPNFDRLAAAGVRFSNAFTHTPVCSPSRGTYMTGLLGTQLGFTDWLNFSQAKSHGVTAAHLTWPAALAKHGYTTGLIGKWHLGSHEKSLPWNNGIIEFTGDLGGGWDPKQVNFINEKQETIRPVGYSVEICTELAMRFTDAHKDKPFALLLHYREPHGAYVPMPEQDMENSRKAKIDTPDFPKLKQPHTNKKRREYYASIAALDRNLGRLLDHLKTNGLAESTIIMFTSDHGYNIGEHGIHHKGNARWITEDRFRNSRPNMFDTSIRVPLLVHHPETATPGAVIDGWVTNADTFASVLGMLGLDKPATMPTASRDWSAAVRGTALPAATFPKEVFGQYDLINDAKPRFMRMIRTERWKLVLHLNASAENELYDLAADPSEAHNLFGQSANEVTVRDLTAKLRGKMAAIQDPRLNEIP